MAKANLKKLQQKLTQVDLVALDTMCFIYHFADHPDYASLTEAIFSLIETQQLQAVTSTISLLEVLVLPEKLQRADLALEYEGFFLNLENLEVVSLHWQLTKLVARLRAKYPTLKVPDLVQIASALFHQADVFVTNDKQLSVVKEIEILQLNDYLG